MSVEKNNQPMQDAKLSSLDTLLQYQTIDMIIFKEERAYLASEQMKQHKVCDSNFQRATDHLLKLNAETVESCRSILDAETQLEKLVSQNKQFLDNTNPINLVQANVTEMALAEYSDKLHALEKNTNKLFSRLSEITQEASQLMSHLQKLNAEKAKLRESLTLQKREIEKKFQSEFLELAKIRETLDPKLLETYSAIRRVKIPIVVQYCNDGSCSACGIDVKAELYGKLKAKGDFAECPNCHRILYVQ
ncbi:MAG: C4-type zinc ribbon domain-containing protein [Christensenellaceae bacterium]|jgi:predicted  nucleic acid-binding Zn-ribbon protein|nr:C4-type zinc ribbon domain-containing protein [Christensenellaceae bacterium]